MGEWMEGHRVKLIFSLPFSVLTIDAKVTDSSIKNLQRTKTSSRFSLSRKHDHLPRDYLGRLSAGLRGKMRAEGKKTWDK